MGLKDGAATRLSSGIAHGIRTEHRVARPDYRNNERAVGSSLKRCGGHFRYFASASSSIALSSVVSVTITFSPARTGSAG